MDPMGNVYVADTLNHVIRKITSDGVATTLAGLAGSQGGADGTGSSARFSFPAGIAADAAGNLYVADTGNHTIRKITSAGLVSTRAAGFSTPRGVAVDGGGNVYVADTNNHTIYKITPAGVGAFAGFPHISGSSDGTGTAARFNAPSGVGTDSAGNIYVADSGNHTIRKITPGAEVTTLAGLAGISGSSDGTGSSARFRGPRGVTVDDAGNLFVADSENHTIRKITPAGSVTTLAGLPGSGGAYDGTGSAARFYSPAGVAVDSDGTVYVADSGNHTIRVGTPIGPSGTCAICHQGVLTLAPSCNSLEYRRHKDHGDSDGACAAGGEFKKRVGRESNPEPMP